MNYGAIKDCDIANGAGVRVTLFVSGCRNHCPGCFQPETQNFSYGEPFTPEVEAKLLKMLERPYIAGLTLLGGEPFEPENQAALLPFVRRVKEKFPQKDIWAFTGYLYDSELTREGVHPNCEFTAELLSYIDVLVDGRFIEELKNISLRFRGSSNQRVIDLKKTRQTGDVCILPDPKRRI